MYSQYDLLKSAKQLKVELLKELSYAKKCKERHSCDQCENTFVTNQALRRHKLIKHDGVRYKCDQCNSQHQYEQGLKNHKRSIHLGVRFTCPECDIKFTKP